MYSIYRFSIDFTTFTFIIILNFSLEYEGDYHNTYDKNQHGGDKEINTAGLLAEKALSPSGSLLSLFEPQVTQPNANSTESYQLIDGNNISPVNLEENENEQDTTEKRIQPHQDGSLSFGNLFLQPFGN